MRSVVPIVLALLLIAGSTSAEDLKIPPDQVYVLLSTTKTSTMEKELAQAASQGFRIVQAASSGVGLLLLLERTPEKYDYKLLATVKIDTLEKEMNDMAKQGHRVLPRTIMTKQKMVGPPEIVCAMEREPGAGTQQRFEYTVLGTSKTSTLEKEILESKAKGFNLVGMTTANERTVIVEREIKGPAAEAPKP